MAARPSSLRHADVHQHDVGAVGVDRGEHLRAVLGLADDREVGGAAEHHRQAGPHERVVVDDEHDGSCRPRQPRPQPVVARVAVRPCSRRPPARLTRSASPMSPAPAPGISARPSSRQRPPADDLDRQRLARSTADRHRDRRPRRVLARVRQPLLHDPVDRAAGRDRQRPPPSTRCASATTVPAARDSSTRSATSRDRRLRALGLGSRGGLGAQHADDLAQVLERLVGARPHDAGRARDLRRRRVGPDLERARVQAQQRDPVREHVVHLARDPRALLTRACATRRSRSDSATGACARAARA